MDEYMLDEIKRKLIVTRFAKCAAAVAIALALVLAPAVIAPQAHALKLPKGYGLSKRDAKSYSLKNRWRKIKTPRCWRTKCTVKPKRFRTWGVIHAKGRTWTWYSQRVLPGGGLRIRGRHLDQRGYVVDWKGRIVLASNEIKRGTVLKTPFGANGIVLDSGCSGAVDVYVGW